MNADWKNLSREAGLRPNGGTLTLTFGDRQHVVEVDDTLPDCIRLTSVVVRRQYAPDDAALQTWKMNRYRELVGFKIVDRGRVIGETWVPRAGLTAEEWKTYVETLARSCDRLEYLWTGKDVE